MSTSPDDRQELHVRAEEPADVEPIALVTGAAFSATEHSAPPVRPGGPPGEVDLVAWLRADEGWLPDLSLVAVADGEVVGHVVCSRGWVDDAPALGLGPVSVLPARQGGGVGSALVRAVLARAEEAGERLVALLGDPSYYSRFGFVPAARLGVLSPEETWGDYFQALPLGPDDHPRGRFRYAAPFSRL